MNTPHGRHLFYRGDFPTGAGKLGPGLDTRGSGRGYIVLPGSVLRDAAGSVEGVYEAANELPIAPAPQALSDRFNAPRKRAADASVLRQPAIEIDRDDTLELARRWLTDDAPLAVERAGGDYTTYRVAAYLHGLGVSEETAFEIMADLWNPRCGPPWSDDELRVKVANGFRYARNAPGSEHPTAAFKEVNVDSEAPGGTWGDPDLTLIADALGAAPPFPRHVLGPALAWCEAVARSANAPLDYGAAGLLTIAGALIGNARVAALDAWAEPPILWTALVGPPSSGKSPALDPLLCLLSDFEAQWARGFGDALRSYEGAVQLAKARRAEWEARFKADGFRHFDNFGSGMVAAGKPEQSPREEGGKVVTTDETQSSKFCDDLLTGAKIVKMPKPPPRAPRECILDGMESLALPVDAMAPEEPVRLRLVIADATIEAVAAISAGNPKGLLLIRDELAGWWRGFDRYSGGAGNDAQLWLSAYGARSHIVDRKKLTKPIRIPRLAVSVLGGVQPDLAAQLLEREADGLTARFLWVYPEPVSGFRRFRETLDHEPMRRAMDRLRSLELVGPRDSPRPVPCNLSPAAADSLESWWCAARAKAHSESGFIGEWLGKAGGLVVRLALILHHLWWAWSDPEGPDGDPLDLPPGCVSLDAIHAAIRLVDDWAEPMARRVAGSAAVSGAEKDAVALVRWLKRQGKSTFNARDARRSRDGPGGRLNRVPALDAACKALAEAGVIRPVAGEPRAGRPRGDFAVNPILFDSGVLP